MSQRANENAFDADDFFEQIQETLDEYPSADCSEKDRIYQVKQVLHSFMKEFLPPREQDSVSTMRERFKCYGRVLHIPLVLESSKSHGGGLGSLRAMCGHIAVSKPQYFASGRVFEEIATLLVKAYAGRPVKASPLVRLNAISAPVPAGQSTEDSRGSYSDEVEIVATPIVRLNACAPAVPAPAAGGKGRAVQKRVPVLDYETRHSAISFLRKKGIEILIDAGESDDEDAVNFQMDTCILEYAKDFEFIGALFESFPSSVKGSSSGAAAGPSSAVRTPSSKRLPLLTNEQRAKALKFLGERNLDLIQTRKVGDDDETDSSDDEDAEKYETDCLIRNYGRIFSSIASLFTGEGNLADPSSSVSSTKRAAPATSVDPGPVATKRQHVVTLSLLSDDEDDEKAVGAGCSAVAVPVPDSPGKDFSRAFFSAMQSCAMSTVIRKAALKRILSKTFDQPVLAAGDSRSFFGKEGFDGFLANVRRCQETYLSPFFSIRSYLVKTSKSFSLNKDQIAQLVDYLVANCIHDEDKDPEH